ncbi:MAG TPA: phosphoglucomutase (alpha-D-glucose-1,6-bisphosphate-dependent) [Burkholderiaceae bacterium]
MSTVISPLAGKPAPKESLVDVAALISAYYTGRPDASQPAQRVAFGTSGHRGTSFELSFNETHVLAITQAICQYRKWQNITGPLFMGVDTHALSQPACSSALEVLAANGVEVMLSKDDEFTPTPAVSLAILNYNRGRDSGFADGIVVTPSHNPPDNGGFKYNPPNGGPAGSEITKGIESAANALIESALVGVKRMPLAMALQAPTTHRYDFLSAYVAELSQVIDFDVIREARLRMGVDPLGGAGVHYWARIAERYQLDLSVISEEVDPRFAFMTLDWDGKIRMDPSSSYAMQRLQALKDRYDIAFACDTDHDRHGIVTPSAGLMPSNDYLAVAIAYLFKHREQWGAKAAVGKTVVSTSLIDRIAKGLGRTLYEVPAGFKWFAEGLLDGSLGFGGEESAGASFLRRNGQVWTTDKDGLVPALLSAEITARTGKNPAELYNALTKDLGRPIAQRVEVPANAEQKSKLAALTPDRITSRELAGEPILSAIDRAPGNDAPLGGIRVSAANGWFAARPSGTEDIYKIYAESYQSEEHLKAILQQAQGIVDQAIGSS